MDGVALLGLKRRMNEGGVISGKKRWEWGAPQISSRICVRSARLIPENNAGSSMFLYIFVYTKVTEICLWVSLP